MRLKQLAHHRKPQGPIAECLGLAGKVRSSLSPVPSSDCADRDVIADRADENGGPPLQQALARAELPPDMDTKQGAKGASYDWQSGDQ